jgi:hypothetical protein
MKNTFYLHDLSNLICLLVTYGGMKRWGFRNHFTFKVQ